MKPPAISRRTFWIGVAVVTVLVIGPALFVTLFERVPVTSHVYENQVALKNPLLAFERFLAAMGRAPTLLQSARDLDALAPGGVLVLGAQRRAAMSPARIAALLRWMEAGGHLIIAAEPNDKDPLLEALGIVTVRRSAPRSSPTGQDGNGQACADPKILVAIQGASRVLAAEFNRTDRTLAAKAEPQPRFGAAEPGVFILQTVRGAGAATAVLSLPDLVTNREIGLHDNAEVLWTLVNLVNPHAPIAVLWTVSTASLWEWLLDSAWMVLFSGAVLLLLWLWGVVPRIGPLRIEPEPERRSVAEHLRAMGRAVWHANQDAGLRYWLFCVRRNVIMRASAHDPGLLREPAAEQAQRIATRVAGKIASSTRAVRTAVAGQPSGTDGRSLREGFTRLVAILQQIESKL